MVVGGRELIDTLWNVNERYSNRCLIHPPELIDTLWNVNVFLLYLIIVFLRINRYIMECKSKEVIQYVNAK